MNTVFADTDYWIATAVPNDQWAEAAKRARESLGDVRLLTTDEVLSDFLAALSAGAENVRRKAVQMVRAILGNPNVKVLPQTRDSFLKGMELYEERPDKSYSLTDCISMNAMRAEWLTEILTHDHHFAQEGCQALISREAGAD